MKNLGDCATVTLVLLLPSKAVDKESNREGAKDASNRKDGNSDGPDCCERALSDGLLVAFKPRIIDEPSNDLAHNRQNTYIYSVYINCYNDNNAERKTSIIIVDHLKNFKGTLYHVVDNSQA